MSTQEAWQLAGRIEADDLSDGDCYGEAACMLRTQAAEIDRLKADKAELLSIFDGHSDTHLYLIGEAWARALALINKHKEQP